LLAVRLLLPDFSPLHSLSLLPNYHDRPLEDADIYIDYQNTGVNLRKVLVQALTSYKIVDTDQDMSGATIFATKKNTGVNGTAVDFACK
jgi:hypothetical protein